uniref:Polymerase nucleotidyl transferase domain-containing protein n=1 Tax=Ammonifex degensii TaxID=42838 RepID=A0A7C2EJ19_9THEO
MVLFGSLVEKKALPGSDVDLLIFKKQSFYR